MKYRPQGNPTLQQWKYMQEQAMQQGYVKKKGCSCGGQKKKKQEDPNQGSR